MTEPNPTRIPGLDRREFLSRASRRGLALGLVGGALPTLLAACGDDDKPVVPEAKEEKKPAAVSREDAREQARALVGDVMEFELHSDEWTGDFGYVTLRLHKGVVDGKDVYYIRTDASDKAFAEAEKLVWVPKLAPLSGPGLSGAAYLVEGGAPNQATVLSSEPNRPDFTPAWTIHKVRWTGTPRLLTSVADIEAAKGKGELAVERAPIVLNAAVVKWSTGELPVDTKRDSYFGTGMLLEAPDTTAMKVTFKLNQCYPNTRYIVTDHSIEPAAKMTATAFAPRLQDGPTKARATGRTNVFLNGIKGPGPMGFQPSVFDFDPGDSAWSPYWDHYAYRWKEGRTPRVITNQTALFAARDAGELEEFPGVPDTKGMLFTVNCPGPIVAPVTFQA